MVFGYIVQSKGINLVHTTKDTQLNFDLPQLLLHLLVQSKNLKLILFVHQKIAYANIFLSFLFRFAFAPPNQLHVKSTNLYVILNSAVGKADLQIITFVTSCLQHPFVIKKFEIFCFLFSDISHILQLPTQFRMDFRVYLFT